MILPMPENAPARVFGVPRNILVEVRLSALVRALELTRVGIWRSIGC